MSDIFASLREPEPVSSPPPEEVRRRGDRLRRRRAGLAVVAAVAAAAIVVGGTSLVVGDRTSSDPVPPAQSPAIEAVIPAQFDLADGLQRAGVSPVSAAPELLVCGETFTLSDRVIASEVVRDTGQGDLNARGLSVYPDADTATAVATDLVADFESCPHFTDRWGRDWTTSVRPTTYGDQGWVVTQFAESSGSRVDFPEAVHIVRLGANLLVLQQREIHGVTPETLTQWSSVQVGSLMRRQMCLLTDEGCAWRSDPDILRPDGWGPLRLGMSREDLKAAGSVDFASAGECTTVDLGSGEGRLSASDELVSIEVPEGVTTPDGIGLGSSQEEVQELYYYAEKLGDLRLVRASPTADYELTVEGGEVSRLRLSTVGNGCSE
jgi:hypothetical protein